MAKRVEIKKRNPVIVILLSLITLGIYYICWFVKTKKEINDLGANIPTAWLLIIPIANLYLMYRYAEGFSNFVKKDKSPVLWFLLFWLITPLAVILFQVELNKLAK